MSILTVIRKEASPGNPATILVTALEKAFIGVINITIRNNGQSIERVYEAEFEDGKTDQEIAWAIAQQLDDSPLYSSISSGRQVLITPEAQVHNLTIRAGASVADDRPKDVWIYALPAEWDALQSDPEVPFSYTYANAKTGYWKSFGPYEVYNVLGSDAEVQQILDALTDVARTYAWTQGDGYDSLSIWPTEPDDVLAVMNDHVTYDEDGNEIDRQPATFENPNWGHIFFGQAERVFAGDYSDDYSGEYF